uniref:interleukin-3-like n=1 Tax=Myodes glareolus TaxID=447135 RepID=UPI0020213511|nr:interleukin-3-like [Myodes glareolus]
MALASSNTSLLSLLLLFLLMLLHQGLQTPVPPSVSASGKASQCNIIVKEILSSIKESNLSEDDVRVKLKILGRCLPKVEGTSEMTGIVLKNDEEDFKQKLRYFVSELKNLLPTPIPTTPHPTSDPDMSCL